MIQLARLCVRSGPFTDDRAYWTFNEHGHIISVLNKLSLQMKYMSGETALLTLSVPITLNLPGSWTFKLEVASAGADIDQSQSQVEGSGGKDDIDMVCRLRHVSSESYLIMNNGPITNRVAPGWFRQHARSFNSPSERTLYVQAYDTKHYDGSLFVIWASELSGNPKSYPRRV